MLGRVLDKWISIFKGVSALRLLSIIARWTFLWALCFSPSLASEVEGEVRLSTQLGGPATFLDIDVSPKGDFVVLAMLDHFSVIDGMTGVVLKDVPFGTSWVNTVAIDPRNRFVVAGGFAGLKIFVLPTLDSGRQLDAGNYQRVAISRNGQYLAASTFDGRVKVWKTGSDFSIVAEFVLEGPLSTVAISDDGSLVAAGQGINNQSAHDGKLPAMLAVWSVRERTQLWRVPAHKNDIVDIAFVRKGEAVLTASGDAQLTQMHGPSLALWNAKTGRQLTNFSGYDGQISGLAITSDGLGMYAVAQDTTENQTEVLRLDDHNGRVTTICSPLPHRITKLALGSSSVGFAINDWARGISVWNGFPTCDKISEKANSMSDRQLESAFLPDGTVILTDGRTIAGANFLSGGSAFKKELTESFVHKVRPGPSDDEFTTLESNSLCVRSAMSGASKVCHDLTGFAAGYEAFCMISPEKVVLATSDSSQGHAGSGELIILDLVTNSVIARQRVHRDVVTGLQLVRDGSIVSSSWDGTIKASRSDDLTTVRTFFRSNHQITSLDMSADRGSFVAGWTPAEEGTVGFWRLDQTRPVWISGSNERVETVHFADGDKTVIVGGATVYELSVSSGQASRAYGGLPLGESVIALASFHDDRFIYGQISGGQFFLWSRFNTPRTIGRIVMSAEGMYVFSDTLFDGDLEKPTSLGWIVADDPLRALPPEIFMRDYYEPNLLRRLIACHDAVDLGDAEACQATFKSRPSIAQLNRVQPDVEFSKVWEAPTPGEIFVEVQVTGGQDETQKNGKTSTAAYDLRLFRNGQLVGRWPDRMLEGGNAGNFVKWRHVSMVPGTERGGTVRHIFKVRLGREQEHGRLELAAYAFNEDRVKSQTALKRYVAKASKAASRPKAYIITVGVNAYRGNTPQLTFAANDAISIGKILADIPGHYVVPVLLISQDARSDSGTTRPATKLATKANIRDVFAVLSRNDPEALARLRAQDPKLTQITQATPDDLVVFAFSGHGMMAMGQFYLLPSDASSDMTQSDTMISSDELTAWVSGIDAGEFNLIIDACHSAAGVPTDFKPGPMGDGGLGQLAYDKRMRILAATQADDVALESGTLGQGLLTYALVKDALERGDDNAYAADSDLDGRITLKEWMAFGKFRVPTLYKELVRGDLKVSKDARPNASLLGNSYTQTPALFDFSKQESAVLRGGD